MMEWKHTDSPVKKMFQVQQYMLTVIWDIKEFITNDGVETHWLSSKEKVPGTAVSKEEHWHFVWPLINYYKTNIASLDKSYLKLKESDTMLELIPNKSL